MGAIRLALRAAHNHDSPSRETPVSTDFWNAPLGPLLRVDAETRLAEVDPAGTPGTTAKKAEAVQELSRAGDELNALQERMYAASQLGSPDRVLLVLQAMDAAGKGGIVNHVIGRIEPYGVQIAAFKKPTPEERAHDFLWRIEPRVPGPGVIGVFDRSHYEDVLIQRVREMAPAQEIERRYGAIVDFERRLAVQGTRVMKVMLHVSPEAQAKRLLERLDTPEKRWKYERGDVTERVLWPAYMSAFETVFARTSTDGAPWHVVPGDNKWYARVAVQRLLIEALEAIGPEWPEPDFDVAAERARVEATLGLRYPDSHEKAM